jgi:N-methylhydantoinase B
VYAGPGGWGDPFTRDPERVRWDVLEEKLTVGHARRAYGVALDPVTLAILPEETARLRAAGPA